MNIFNAIESGNIADIERFINMGLINSKNQLGDTALMVAVKNGNLNVVNLLLHRS